MKRVLALLCSLIFLCASPAEEARPTLSAKGLEAVKQIEQAVDAKQVPAAEALAREFIRKSAPDSFDAVIGQLLLSEILLSLERYAEAIPPLEYALASGMFEPEVIQRYRKALAHLHYQTGNVALAESILAELTRLPQAPPDVLLFHAVLLLELKRPEESLHEAERLLQASLDPEPGAYQLAAAAAQDLNRTETVIGYLERLVELRPDQDSYWRQLVAAHYAAGNTLGALVALERAQQAGQLLGARDRMMRIEFYYNLDRFSTAAALIESGMADQSLEVDQGTWQLLSYCYDMNDQPERARDALERASRETPYSAIDLQLAERNWREQRFADTIRNLESALRKGDIDRPGDLWILMTSAAMELRDIDRAEQALATARGFPEQAAKVDRLERSLARLKQSLEQ